MSWRAAALAIAVTLSTAQAQSVVRVHVGEFPESTLGGVHAGGGDLNGDGAPDYVISEQVATASKLPAIFAFSGIDGAILWNTSFPTWFCAASSIDICGDISGDGKADVLVGLPFCNQFGVGGNQGGSVIVFSGADGSLIRTHSGDGVSGDTFGLLVRCIGDADGDGVNDYVVREPYGDSATSISPPSLWLFSGGAGVPLWADYMPYGVGSGFGYAVEPIGDANGDGLADFATSAPFLSVSGMENAGVVVLHSALTTTPLSVINGYFSQQSLGLAIGSLGDFSGDLTSELVCTDVIGVNYVTPGAPSPIQPWIANPPSKFVGRVLDVTDDINSDGRPDILLSFWGASDLDHGLWVADGFSGQLLQKRPDIYSTQVQNLTDFPRSISSLGDIDGDSRSEWAIGHGFAKTAGSKRGVLEVLSGRPLYAHAKSIVPGSKNVKFTISGGLPNAGRPYFLVASVSGTAGITLPMSTLPLTYDFFTEASIILANGPVFQNSFGYLSMNLGMATATFDGMFLPPSAAGLSLHFAFAILDSNGDWSSNAESILIDLL